MPADCLHLSHVRVLATKKEMETKTVYLLSASNRSFQYQDPNHTRVFETSSKKTSHMERVTWRAEMMI